MWSAASGLDSSSLEFPGLQLLMSSFLVAIFVSVAKPKKLGYDLQFTATSTRVLVSDAAEVQSL